MSVALPPADRLGPWALDAVHAADCREALATLPTDSVDVVVTSPPYWGQRGAGGLGAEPDPRDYVAALVAVLAEALRCLKPSGTLWLNLGDAYNTPINWRPDDHGYSTLGKARRGLAPTNQAYTKDRGRRRAFVQPGVGWLRYGNLLALPWRVVLGLTDLGFLLRGEIVWEKARPLPEGRCRRPHRRHEPIYVLAKDEQHTFQIQPPVGSVWRLVQTPGRSRHDAAFPLELPLRCIEASALTRPGIVLDPFMGSGTTGRAARRLGHRYLGFEVDPRICEQADIAIGQEPTATIRSDPE